MEIPVIDISPFIVGTSGQKEDTAEKLRKACLEHGFFYISKHGVSKSLQFKLETLSKEFFELPMAEKQKIRMELGGPAWRGYFHVGEELTSGKPDQKEGIYFGEELSDNHQMVMKKVPLHGRNLFPETPSELRQVVLEYMDKMTELAKMVMRCIAISLGLDEYHFEETICKDPFILFRIFHYPHQSDIDKNWGVGEHTDYGLLTILKQDSNGGLELKSKGKWIAASPIENTFICNIGDMLEIVTGGLFVSTPHRVKNTSGLGRLSFPFFFDPNFDASIKPIRNSQSTISNQDYRWDGQDLSLFNDSYGDYVTSKVSKVFPKLFDSL